jgi:transcriptional regulator GlxA family with amidase domain
MALNTTTADLATKVCSMEDTPQNLALPYSQPNEMYLRLRVMQARGALSTEGPAVEAVAAVVQAD